MYNLSKDRLDAARISERLSPFGIEVYVLPRVDSTNTEAKRRAQSGADKPTLIIAESQSAGRGRMGRSFYSPRDTGVYMSLLVEARGGFSQTIGITSAAAVATARAISSICGIETGIKWVNDIYLDDKKVAGILAESFFVEEKLFLIIGIGVNLYTTDFPEELCDIAGSLRSGKGDRSELAAEICKELITLILALPDRSFMREYRQRSIVLEKRVTFVENGEALEGFAESISDDGALTVLLDDGKRHELKSGEISLKVKKM